MITKFSEFRLFFAQVLAMVNAVPSAGVVPAKDVTKVREIALKL